MTITKAFRQNAACVLLLLQASLATAQDPTLEMSAREFFNSSLAQENIPTLDPDRDRMEIAIFHATNEIRRQEGLDTLQHDPRLEVAARYHSEQMRKKDFFAHQNPHNDEMKKPRQRIEHFKGDFKETGENIATVNIYHTGDDFSYFKDSEGRLVSEDGKPLRPLSYGAWARGVVQYWMKSKGHRANLLGNYSYLGCGVSRIFTPPGKDLPRVLITQNFGLK